MLRTGIIILMTVTSAFADQVVFTNGDRVSGTVKQMTEGKLVITSDIAGEITVNMSKVESIETDSKIELHLSDGSVLQTRLESAQGETYITDANETAVKTELSKITALNPPATQKPRWTGDVAAGLSSSHGNTRAEWVSLSANLKKRTEDDRTNLSSDLVKSRQKNPDTGDMDTTEDWWRAKGRYDYFFTKKFFGYVDVRYETDEIAQLERRVVYGVGPGYQWVETERIKFSTQGGFASIYEKFENQTSNNDFTLQAGYDLELKINSKLSFMHNLTYYPTFENVSDYYLTSEAELRANLWTRMFANFKVIFDYNATPANEASNTDVKYLLGIGYSF